MTILFLAVQFLTNVACISGEFKSTADYQYQLLRCNVDLLKIIQLGLTFLDEKGKVPESGPSTWQFNFKFNLTEDMYAEDSVDLLQNSGIQFEKHEQVYYSGNMKSDHLKSQNSLKVRFHMVRFSLF